MNRRNRKRLTATALGLALLVGLLAASSLWFPWLLQPLLARYGISFDSFQRIGISRVALNKVQGAFGLVTFNARRLELPLPMNWLWHRFGKTDRAGLVMVEDWQVQVAKAPAQPSERSPVVSRSESSLFGTVQGLRTVLRPIQVWLPYVELSNGTIRMPSEEFRVSRITWRNGTLSGVAQTARAAGQTIELTAQLGGTNAWQLSSHVRPWGVDLNLQLNQRAAAIELLGQIAWKTNQARLSAEFARRGWLPFRSSVQAESFRVPLDLVGVKGYRDGIGSLSFDWVTNEFKLGLTAKADPIRSDGGYPAFEIRLQASGDTNRVRIDEGVVRSAGITAEISPGLLVDFQGHIVSEGTITASADLLKQRWFQAEGLVKASVFLQPGNQLWPNGRFQFAGSGLKVLGVRMDGFDCSGELAWPWLEVRRGSVTFEGGATAQWLVRYNVENETVANGVFHFEGEIGNQVLPGQLRIGRALIHANIKGPSDNLDHEGVVEADGLVWGAIAPLSVRASWHGKSTALELFQASISATNTIGRLKGSAKAEAGHPGLRLEELTLERGGQRVFSLEQPFAVSLRRDAQAGASKGEWLLDVEPVYWQGPVGRVALQANIAWPHQGTLAADLRGIDSAMLTNYWTAPLPQVVLDHFQLSAGWTNGPLSYAADLLGRYSPVAGLPLEARLLAHNDGESLVLDQLRLTHHAEDVLTGRGSFPLRIDPTNLKETLRISAEASVDLQFKSAPNKAFWEQVSAWTKISWVDPHLELTATGQLASLQGRLTAEIAAIKPHLTVTNLTVPAVEELRTEIILERRAVRVDKLQMRIEGQPVTAALQVPFGDDIRVRWRKFFFWNQATGRVDVAQATIAPLARFWPTILAPQGTVALAVSIRPNVQLDGYATVTGAAFRPLATIGTIDHLDSRLIVRGHRLDLETLAGKLGGEPFALSGSVDFDRGNPATGMPQIALQLRGTSLPLARRTDLIIRSDLDLRLESGGNQPLVISGVAHLRDSVFLSDLRSLRPGRIASPRQRPPFFSIELPLLSDWGLNLEVKGDRFLKVRTPFFRGVVSTDLKLTGTLKEPVALGDVTVKSGVVQFPFANLTVVQGLASLTSDDPYRPSLFFSAAGRTLGYDVKLEVTGKADSPVIEFNSTPPLSSEQVLLMLTAGELPRQDNFISTQQRAARLAMFVGRSLLTEFSSDGADRLTIHSGENISDEGKQTYSLEYRLTKDWSIVGEYDRFGAFNADLKWRIYSH